MKHRYPFIYSVVSWLKATLGYLLLYCIYYRGWLLVEGGGDMVIPMEMVTF